jgi:hypothetical protein
MHTHFIFNLLFLFSKFCKKMNRYRKFNDLPTEFESNKTSNDLLDPDIENLFEYISKSEIGSNQHFTGPFGSRQSRKKTLMQIQ